MRLLELLEHFVHFLHGGAGTGGDAAFAAGFEQGRVGALFRGHGIDDGFHFAHGLFRRAFRNLCGKLPHFAGQFGHQRFDAAHIAHLLDLGFEIVQVEAFAFVQLFGHAFGHFLIDAFLHVFNQGKHVAHAENAARDAVGVEGFEAADFFAGADEFNRFAGNVAHGKRRAAACVAVHFGEDNAGERQGFVEGLGGVHGILAEHGIHYKQGFHRIHGFMQRLDFGHHGFVHRQSAGSIDHQHVVEMLFGVIQRGLGDGHGLLGNVGGEEIRAHLLGQEAQLLDGGGAVYVGRHQQHFLALLFFEQAGELTGGGGFTRTLQAGHQHHGRGHGGQVEAAVLRAHQLGERLVDHADKGLAGREAADYFVADGAFFHAGHKVFHHRQCHVGFQQRHAHFAQGFFDVVFGEARLAAHFFGPLAEAAG